MNTGQMMLTICGMVLLSTLVLNMNRNYDIVTTDISANKFDIMAVEVATTYLENVKNSERIAFDENTINTYLSDATGLSTLGKDASESRTNIDVNTYDDVDDFNNDTTHVDINSGVKIGTTDVKTTYYIRGLVEYYDASTFATTSTKKFHKKVTVKVVCALSPTDTVRLSTIISFWKFR